MEAIVCATGRAAECMQRPDLGALEPGRLADVVVVEGDPLSDIKLLQGRDKIKLIMKDGEFYKQELVE
jgi:imidazolonepropionase-like amidohydrolase